MYIKSFSPKAGLSIKAVGIVADGRVRDFGDLGKGVAMRWVWSGKESVGKIDDKWPVRGVTIYEEFHPRVQSKVLELLLEGR